MKVHMPRSYTAILVSALLGLPSIAIGQTRWPVDVACENNWGYYRTVRDSIEVSKLISDFHEESAVDLDAAITLGEAILSRMRRVVVDIHPSVAGLMEQLAHLHEVRGNDARAGTLYGESIAIVRRLYGGISNPVSAKLLADYGSLCMRRGDVDKAIRMLSESLRQHHAMFGETMREDVVETTRLLGLAHLGAGDTTKAKELLETVFSFRNRNGVLVDNPENGITLHKLAVAYAATGATSRANSMLVAAIAMYRRILRNNDRSVLMSALTDLGLVNMSAGNVDTAVKLLCEGVTIGRQLADRGDGVAMARCLDALAQCFAKQSDCRKSMELSAESVALLERRCKGADSLELAIVLIHQSKTVSDVDGFESALPPIERSLSILRKLNANRVKAGPAFGVWAIGLMFAQAGETKRAFALLQESLGMFRRCYPGNNEVVLRHVRGLAQYAGQFDDSSYAMALFQEARNMSRRIHKSDESPDHANCLSEIAHFYASKGDSTREGRFLSMALSMRRRIYAGHDDMDLVESLNGVAIFNLVHKSYEIAEPLLVEAMAMSRRLDHGRISSRSIRIMSNLGYLYLQKGDIGRSDSLNRLVLRLNRAPLNGATCLTLVRSILDAGISAEFSGNVLLADSLNREFLWILSQVGIEAVVNADGVRQVQLQQLLSWQLNAAFSYLLRHNRAEALMNATLWSKRSVLERIAARARIVADVRQSDTCVRDAWRLLHVVGKYALDIRTPSRDGYARWSDRRRDVRRRYDEAESVLSKVSPTYSSMFRRIDWHEVQRRLTPHDAAVEFLCVRYFNGLRWTDSIVYSALVLRPGFASPALVSLGDERPLADILRTPVFPVSRDQSSYVHDAAKSAMLYRRVWAPIDTLLLGARRVFVCPDGVLTRVSFAVLKDRDGVTLADRYDFRYVVNFRDLVDTSKSENILNKTRRTASIFGNVNYDCEPLESVRKSNRSEEFDRGRDTERFDDQSGSVRGVMGLSIHENLEFRACIKDTLSTLPGTQVEIDTVARILARHSYQTAKISWCDATEDAFYDVICPSVLHVATHGFAFDTPEISACDLERDRLTDNNEMIGAASNPMLRSGLLFAGSGRISMRQPPVQGTSDGIVTASDIARMDLCGTHLVALSACNTGLGDIMTIEGVYGLQRAFIAAGCRAVLVSLWEVPDRQTRELMILFYTNWLDDGMSKPEALHAAQREMAKRYDDPYYWGAFVLVGE